PFVTLGSVLCLLSLPLIASGQQAVSPSAIGSGSFGSGTPAPLGVDRNGMALAQTNPAIEQSRLLQQAVPPVNLGVDANGTVVGGTEATQTEDDSFGAQLILKAQERPRAWVVSGGVSVIYTDNVGLAAAAEKDDAFIVANAAIGWSKRLSQTVEANVGVQASVFRYDKASELDFQNVGFGAGLVWNPPALRGVSLFGRYDLTELFGSDGRHILLDNVLTLGAQKAFVFGRSHSMAVGVVGSTGLADPGAAQRSQLGAYLGYRLQLTRKLETDFLYRPAVHIYSDTGRVDFNQIISWNLRYRFSDWADLNAFMSYGLNRSERSSFDYNVFTGGAGVGVNIRF
ncbi:MAG TPA: hypothetical protein VK993_08850, partial [Chthoniobacterales bacterium]|nr:hypothetical protein [Chthoniobacterales bacterium]